MSRLNGPTIVVDLDELVGLVEFVEFVVLSVSVSLINVGLATDVD